MTRQFLKDAFGWGFLLWLVGYVLGIVLFVIVPSSSIGWILTPIGTALTLWVLFARIKGQSLGYFVCVGLVWAAIAVICDYLLLYKLFRPADGYYKLDVYLYYALTFLLPVAVGWWRLSRKA